MAWRRLCRVGALLGAMVFCAACGAAPGATSGAAVTAGASAPSGGAPTAEMAGHARAVALLDLLPAFPGSQAVTSDPYVSVASPGLAPPPNGNALGPGVGTPASPYLIDLYREWRVPAAAGAVLSWIQKQAAGKGLVQEASAGPCVGAGCRRFMVGVAFGTGAHAGLTPGLEVAVESTGHGQSVVRYDALVIWTPPRPVGESLPAGITRVHIQVQQGLPQEAVRAVTLTSPGAVARLVALVGSLPVDTRGVHSCPVDVGREVVLDFLGAAGVSITVTEGGCDSVRFGSKNAFPALADPGRALWKAGTTLAGEPGWA